MIQSLDGLAILSTKLFADFIKASLVVRDGLMVHVRN